MVDLSSDFKKTAKQVFTTSIIYLIVGYIGGENIKISGIPISIENSEPAQIVIAVYVFFTTVVAVSYLFRDVLTYFANKIASAADFPEIDDIQFPMANKDQHLLDRFNWVFLTTSIIVFIIEAIVPISLGVVVIGMSICSVV